MQIVEGIGYGSRPTLALVTDPGPNAHVLRTRAREVTTADLAWAERVDLIAKMHALCAKLDGLGLAAPQVGLPWRLFVMQVPQTGERLTFVNPEITERSDVCDTDLEGCLSLPGRRVLVRRSVSVVVRNGPYTEHKGKVQHTPDFTIVTGPTLRRFDGLAARCVQHEIDHLDGILITDPRRS